MALFLLVGLFAVTACTQSQGGQASPAPTTGSGPETTGSSPGGTSGSAAPTVTIPSRPRDLRLDGLDPCALFTAAQQTELKIDRTRKRTNGSQQYKGMPECVLSVEKQAPRYQYVATAATNEGIAPWLSGKRNVDAKLSTVRSFPAATFWSRGANGTNADGCMTAVDVADGQQLIVDTNNDGAHSFTLEQLCQRAEQAAGLAVQTLQTLK